MARIFSRDGVTREAASPEQAVKLRHDGWTEQTTVTVEPGPAPESAPGGGPIETVDVEEETDETDDS